MPKKVGSIEIYTDKNGLWFGQVSWGEPGRSWVTWTQTTPTLEEAMAMSVDELKRIKRKSEIL